MHVVNIRKNEYINAYEDEVLNWRAPYATTHHIEIFIHIKKKDKFIYMNRIAKVVPHRLYFG